MVPNATWLERVKNRKSEMKEQTVISARDLIDSISNASIS
jgi:hypothetical protein